MYYNSLDEQYKCPVGAVKLGEKIEFFIESPDTLEAYLVIKRDDMPYVSVPMQKAEKNGKFGFKTEFVPSEAMLYFYHFQINEPRETKIIQKNYDIDYQLTVYEDFTVPKWYKNAIIYQIFPDRFYNPFKTPIAYKPNSFIYATWKDKPMNIINEKKELVRQDFYGGNLYGVIEKLDYLKLLGIDVIYFNPIFESNSNHKYNTKDYHKIDSMLGDEETFKKLIAEAKKRDIEIILDGVFNHTGDDSEYFISAKKDKSSKYYSWYYFKEYPNVYESWWGFDTLPKVNCMDESYQNFIMGEGNSVLNHWTSLGVKGWRLDVVDELDGSFVEKFKANMRKVNEESVLIGEVWEDASNKTAYSQRKKYFMGHQLDSVMGYPFKENVQNFLNGNINGYQITENFKTLWENYPREAFYANMNLISTHDTPRCINVLNFDETNFKSAVTVQMTFAGVPHIYYADEVGEIGQMCPDNRRGFPWGEENEEILNFYKKLINLRKNNNIFVDGEIEFFYLNDDVFSYKRYFKDDPEKVVYVMIMRKNTLLSLELKPMTVFEYFSGETIKCGYGTLNHNFDKGCYIISTYPLN
ncbi:MAG: glycoside hydrolase family 13 protein [Peptoanaerobacter stomatis]|uniref:glycoside hydrolase family 13 protein n=1 Tax=Peptoanaerobacter stomatis TaxID=796937 RepID=UPI003FA0BE53